MEHRGGKHKCHNTERAWASNAVTWVWSVEPGITLLYVVSPHPCSSCSLAFYSLFFSSTPSLSPRAKTKYCGVPCTFMYIESLARKGLRATSNITLKTGNTQNILQLHGISMEQTFAHFFILWVHCLQSQLTFGKW